MENLFSAWREFRRGKRKSLDVQKFEFHLEDNIFELHEELKTGQYRHGPYEHFKINDPKPRLISKASVKDRLLHHAVYRIIYPLFDKTFIYNSYSCRKNKGTHRGFKRLFNLLRRTSHNFRRLCFALKCDIQRFFDNIDHQVLSKLLHRKINDDNVLRLLKVIIESFTTAPGKGVPLGNLTSQLFANIYLDPLDKFVIHGLNFPNYIRYADDFVLVSFQKQELLDILVEIKKFLKAELRLSIHPQKIILRKLAWGIDFVGYVVLPFYILPRRRTVKRIFKRINKLNLPSYLGYLRHANAYKISQKLIWLAGCVN